MIKDALKKSTCTHWLANNCKRYHVIVPLSAWNMQKGEDLEEIEKYAVCDEQEHEEWEGRKRRMKLEIRVYYRL